MSRDAKHDWEAVYRAEAANLWRSLVLQTGSPDIASDAVAEAFAQGIARGDAVRTPGAWVWKAGFINSARAEAGRLRADLPVAQGPGAAALEPVLDLLDGLRTLSSMQRSATVLHYFAGYSLAETAAIIGSTGRRSACISSAHAGSSATNWRTTMSTDLRTRLGAARGLAAPDLWHEATTQRHAARDRSRSRSPRPDRDARRSWRSPSRCSARRCLRVVDTAARTGERERLGRTAA